MTSTQVVEWFQKWRKPIRVWLRNRRSVAPSEVDDLTQEVFLRMLKYSQSTKVDHPQAYLFRIANNVANEWHGRARISKPHDDAWLNDLLIEEEQQPEQIKMHEQLCEAVQSAIEHLPARQQITMLLKMDNMDYKEIAKEREVTPRVAMRDIHRAYDSLRTKLTPSHIS